MTSTCIRRLTILALVMSVSGCVSGSPPRLRLAKPNVRGSTGPPLTQWLAQHTLAPQMNIRADELRRTTEFSTHFVQIHDREPLHVHEYHDLDVILRKGHGALLFGSDRLDVVPGDLIHIPMGTPHAFINDGDEPAVAFAVFTPPFDGKDTIQVEE